MDYYENLQTGEFAPSGYAPTDAEAERDAWYSSPQGQSYSSPGGIPGNSGGNTTIYQDPYTGGYTNVPTTTDMTLYSGPDIMNNNGGYGGMNARDMTEAVLRGMGGGAGPTVSTPSTPTGGGGMGYYEARDARLAAEAKAFSDKIWNTKSGPSSMVFPSTPGAYSASSSSGIPDRTTIQYATPTVPMPSMTAPTFTAPETDKAAISARIQEIMAPQASALKRAVREALARRRFGSPVLDKYTLEGALEGYGRGLGEVQGKAQPAGRQAYFQEDYQPKYNAALTNYNALMQAALQNWQGQMQNYIQTMQHTTESYTPSS